MNSRTCFWWLFWTFEKARKKSLERAIVIGVTWLLWTRNLHRAVGQKAAAMRPGQNQRGTPANRWSRSEVRLRLRDRGAQQRGKQTRRARQWQQFRPTGSSTQILPLVEPCRRSATLRQRSRTSGATASSRIARRSVTTPWSLRRLDDRFIHFAADAERTHEVKLRKELKQIPKPKKFPPSLFHSSGPRWAKSSNK